MPLVSASQAPIQTRRAYIHTHYRPKMSVEDALFSSFGLIPCKHSRNPKAKHTASADASAANGSSTTPRRERGYEFAVHNELGNILSHGVPGLAVPLVATWHLGVFLPSFGGYAGGGDYIAAITFFAGLFLCFACSATYHALVPVSIPVAHVALRIDRAGIVAVLAASLGFLGHYLGFERNGPNSVSGILGFHPITTGGIGWATAAALLSLGLASLGLFPGLSSPRTPSLLSDQVRKFTSSSSSSPSSSSPSSSSSSPSSPPVGGGDGPDEGCAACPGCSAPFAFIGLFVAVAVVLWGACSVDSQLGPVVSSHLTSMYSWYAVGVAAYILRIPEGLPFFATSSLFDRIGQSHQIMHVCIVVGSVHFYALVLALQSLTITQRMT